MAAKIKQGHDARRARREDLQGPRARLRRRPRGSSSPSTIRGSIRCSRWPASCGMPIAIHTGDPKAFWKPPTPDNERFDELRVHPGWSFFGAPVTLGGALRAVRAARGAPPEDDLHRRALRQRPGGSGARRADARPAQEPVRSTRRRACPRSGASTRTTTPRGCARSSRSTRTASCSAPTSASATADEDLMLGSTGATPPGPADVERFFDVDLALVRDRRQADPVADADPGALERRRHRPAARGAREGLPRQRREAARREASDAVIALDTRRGENIITRR